MRVQLTQQIFMIKARIKVNNNYSKNNLRIILNVLLKLQITKMKKPVMKAGLLHYMLAVLSPKCLLLC